MRRKYKIITCILLIEFLFLSMLNRTNVSIDTWAFSSISVFVLCIPLLVLFHMLSKDEKMSKKTRLLSKVVFWFVIFCYIVGGIGKSISISQQ